MVITCMELCAIQNFMATQLLQCITQNKNIKNKCYSPCRRSLLLDRMLPKLRSSKILLPLSLKPKMSRVFCVSGAGKCFSINDWNTPLKHIH